MENITIHKDIKIVSSKELIPLDRKYSNRNVLPLYEKYSGKYGNSINHIVTAIDALQYANCEERLVEIRDNISTSITERVQASIAGECKYDAKWDNGHMIFNGRNALEFYNNAITNDSMQIPEFERNRNMVNLDNLIDLEYYKKTYDSGFFVEISPTPVLNEESIQRGYDGRDTVFIYDLNKKENIPVTQHWFNSLPKQDYEELYDKCRTNEGIIIGPNVESPRITNELLSICPDLQIMTNYLYVKNEKDLDTLLKFLDKNKENTNLTAERLFNNEVSNIDGRIQNILMPKIFDSAIKVSECPDFNLSSILNEINDFIFDEQLHLKLKLLDEANVNTFRQYMQQYIQSEFRNYEMIKENYIAEGCGFSIDKGKSGSVDSSVLPNVSNIFGLTDPVVCPDCKHTFYVKNGDTSTYYEYCPFCHSHSVCCK